MTDATDAQPTASPPAAPRRLPAAGHLLVWAALVIVLLAGDLYLKHWSFENVPAQPIRLDPPVDETAVPHDAHMPLIPYVLDLRLTLNPGAVFGIAKGKRWIFVGITFLAIIAIGWMFAKTHPRQWVTRTALAFILAGALGNLYDRLVYGVVRDMLFLFPDVYLPFGWTWHNGDRLLYPWLFNLADALLVTGITTLLILSLFAHDPQAAADQGD